MIIDFRAGFQADKAGNVVKYTFNFNVMPKRNNFAHNLESDMNLSKGEF